ncbi:Oxidoreductase, molybdopterin-binding domain-containing protein [Microdochium bolleyi]|uniref:Nitrate reductase [NADPH] n=1 Tax=Microdochium bolleyi TaxID=196109 RepID=A0A136IPN2_9PEZI|nr:Oxidoreductase, molybdopterin-binding domain-containing protein [Microdochium bolleyi]
MSVPASRHLARRLFQLSTRQSQQSALRQLTATALSSSTKPTQTCCQFSRPFSFRAAFRDAAPKPARSKPSSDGSAGRARRFKPLPLLAAGSGVFGLGLALAFIQPAAQQHSVIDVRDDDLPLPDTPDDKNDGLPRFRLSEIKEHGPHSERPWVTYEDKVFDITEWVGAHPGGEVILRAAGGAIEPYWDIFAIHKAPYVREILEQYVVGRIHPDDLVDGRPAQDQIEDPFRADPDRDGRMRFITSKPCNAETPGSELAESFLTPNEVFYVRNHMWVPVVKEGTEADNHTISIELPDGETRVYTVGELKARFKQYTISAVLQCSGNRRKDMTDHAKKTNGLQWTVGAISCAKWEGVRLRDVLADAGLSLADPGEDAQHVQFTGLEAYGASIPISSAIDPRGDVLLAFRMNDMPLPRDHGFPVRVIVPGHVAARAVKWVNKIVVSDEESQTQWQRRDYKCFGPNETTQDWDKYKSIQEMPITSAITRTRLIRTVVPNPSIPVLPPATASSSGSITAAPNVESLAGQIVQLEGYAYSGGGREIQRVDVSLDGGKTWDQARLINDKKLEQGSKAWCWKRWQYEGPLPEGTVQEAASGKEKKTTFVVKATDEVYNTQPETHQSIYNLRGNLATAWHRVDFDCGTAEKPCPPPPSSSTAAPASETKK